ncbi:DoxX family protein [Arenimonas terrae]|jgi:putative oxidoreductase|uniref:DoxX family protein n=1 Tax=Arenimonas terrae TaxID=2546226 RepID=A0A5C4RW18_9GAMM|nr:DoxX family protein [Arenimonas terrae]TNJ35165.1 DoxX family protein [Arenimonas terrae]
MRNTLSERWTALTERLDGVGDWLAPLGLRLILAWEFWEAGIEKFRGENWFASIQSDFPFPFDRVPPDLSWTLATWFELGGAVALLLGLGTRFFAFNLFVLTMVATASVHWPMNWQTLQDLAMGYAISDKGFGNFKLPLIFAVMLLPLVFKGAGRFSLDALIAGRLATRPLQGVQDTLAWGLAGLVIGLPLSLLLPTLGLTLAAIGLLLVALDRLLLA